MPESIAYYRKREASAREAAARATDSLAIRLHLEMAEGYAKIVASGENIRLLLDARQPTRTASEDADTPRSST